jgi:hypothetical protein
MKNKLSFLVLIASVILGLNSCSKESLVQVNGKLTGNVRDIVTNNYLENVRVKVMVDKNTFLKDSSNALGNFSIYGIPMGEHQVVFSKDGYATIRQSVYFEEFTGAKSEDKLSTTYGMEISQQMYPLTGKLKGLVTYYGAPAVGATVTVYVSTSYIYSKSTLVSSSDSEFEPYAYTATTGANGEYSFTNLPVGAYAYIVASNGTASGNTRMSRSISDTPNSISTWASTIDMEEEPLYLVNYTGKATVQNRLDTLATNSTITLTFSENVSEAITKAQGGYVRLTDGSSDVVATTVTYSNNTITIVPSNNLIHGGSYTLEVNVYSSVNKSVSDIVISYQVVSAPNIALTQPAIQSSGSNLLLTIAANANVIMAAKIRYDVYESDGLHAFILTNANTEIHASTTLPATLITGTTVGHKYYVVPVSIDDFEILTYGPASAIVTR